MVATAIQYTSSGSACQRPAQRSARRAYRGLLNGSYSGSFTINTDGTSSRSIRIEAANCGGVSLTSDLNLYGAYIQVLGLAFWRGAASPSAGTTARSAAAASSIAAWRLVPRRGEPRDRLQRVPQLARNAAIDTDPIYNGFCSVHNCTSIKQLSLQMLELATLGITVGHQPSHTDRNVNAIIGAT
ncbi:MAG: hypothetical protein R3D25_10095 [Geminicoccaceae bacterium]